MSSSNLIRWGGLAAVVAGVLYLITDLIGLLIFGFGQRFSEVVITSGLFFRSIIAPVAGALVLLGLVGLYAHQLEAVRIPGLVSFLVAFCGTVWAQSFILGDLLANLGWALFGVSTLSAKIYPRIPAILLILGAVSTGTFSALPRSEPGSILMHLVISADMILNLAISWLGFNLFLRRTHKGTQRSS